MIAPPPGEPRAAGPTRNWEVAVLIAQGYTNRRIAQQPAMTERNVETHVSRILCKLRLRSRTQFPRPPELRPNVEVFQIDAGLAEEGREGVKEKREGGRAPACVSE